MGGREWAKKLGKEERYRGRRDGPKGNFVTEQGKIKYFRPLLERGTACHRGKVFVESSTELAEGSEVLGHFEQW